MSINADQNHGIDPKCLSIPIIADQFLSNIGINARILSGIDRYWSALGIDRGSPDISEIAMTMLSLKSFNNYITSCEPTCALIPNNPGWFGRVIFHINYVAFCNEYL